MTVKMVVTALGESMSQVLGEIAAKSTRGASVMGVTAALVLSVGRHSISR
jgi:hypothetical protein